MKHTNKATIYTILFFLFAISIQFTKAQVSDKLKEKVEQANPPKPKTEEKTNPDGTKADGTNKTAADTTKPKSNGNPNGQAKFDVNGVEIDPKSLGQANTMGTTGKAGKEDEKEVKITDNVRVIDTTRFIARNSVKKRDQDLYKGGFKNTPITHKHDDHHTYTLAKDKYVFGWHPYWVDDAYRSYNFSVLNVVAYYSYEVEPSTGDYKDLHDWKDTDLVTYAHKKNPACKVLLSASLAGKRETETFLQNPDAQANFVRKITKLVSEKGANGVHLDFESIPLSQKDAFTNFVIDLSAKLRTEIKGAFVSLSLPAIDFDYVYDVRQLTKTVNLFVVNGFEFYGSNSEIAGPISQIKSGGTWWNHSLETSIDMYLASGAEPQKMLLGVSYYGAEWVTKDLKTPSESRKFLKYLTYRDIKQKIGFATPSEDAGSMSNFYVSRDDNGNYRQIWYDDSLSLAKKYDWVLEKKLGGVGIWALGYDNGHPQLWQALGAKFGGGIPKQKARQPINAGFLSRFINPIARLISSPKMALQGKLTFFVSFLALFGAVGAAFYALYRYSCYFSQVFLLILRGSVTALLLALVYVIVLGFNLADGNILYWLLVGVFIGAMVFFLLVRNFITEKQLP